MVMMMMVVGRVGGWEGKGGGMGGCVGGWKRAAAGRGRPDFAEARGEWNTICIQNTICGESPL